MTGANIRFEPGSVCPPRPARALLQLALPPSYRLAQGSRRGFGLTELPMPITPVDLLDASKFAWPAFVDALYAIRDGVERDGTFSYIRPPRGCEREARNAIHNLGLADYVELLDRAEPVPRDCAQLRERHRGVGNGPREIRPGKAGWQL